MNDSMHPSWCTRTHGGDAHAGVKTHIDTRWSAPGRGVEVDVIDLGHEGELVPVIRVLFVGDGLAQLFTLTEARLLAQVLTSLAARADDG